MVRNPDTPHPGCRIHYRDIGDYLTREEKLQTLVELGSTDGIPEWQIIHTGRTSRLDQPERPNLEAPDYELGHQDAKAEQGRST